MTNMTILKNISQLTEFQKESINRSILDFLNLNDSISIDTPTICPCCGKAHSNFIKRGFANGKQRFQCKECEARFVYDKGRLTYCSQQSTDVWAEVIVDTLNESTLMETAAKLNLSIPTIFFMRHKFLLFLETIIMNNTSLLSGVIELDETYVNDAYKGTTPIGRLP